PQGLMRRDREIQDISQRLDNLSIAEIGLMFGRIDVADEEPENPVPGSPDLDRRYIGRLGLHTRDDEMRTLLMDWRAPMARPLYLATRSEEHTSEPQSRVDLVCRLLLEKKNMQYCSHR